MAFEFYGAARGGNQAVFGRSQAAGSWPWRAGTTCSVAVHRRRDIMKVFVHPYEDRIPGVLSCFDRMLLRGHLHSLSGWSAAQFLKAHEIGSRDLMAFVLANAHRLIAKIPRTRRWRVTHDGRNVLGTWLVLREHRFPNVNSGVTH